MQPPIYVHKKHKHGAYTSIPNESMQNQSLSWAARGLLSYMLTMPGHWQLNEKDLIGRAPTGRDHLRSIVRELEAAGHLTRTPVRGPGGKILRMVWDVWDLPVTDRPSTAEPLTENPSVVEPLTDYPSTENPSVDKTQPPQPVSAISARNVHPTTDGLTVDGKPVRLEKKHLRNKQNLELEPPLPPKAEPAPQAATPTKRQPSAKARQQPFNPTVDDIPADLLPVDHELLDFWAEKRGARSQRAWNGLCAELQKIHRDPNGGTDTIRAQLNAAIQSGWQSVTFANWQRYGAPAQPSLPLGSSHTGRYTSRAEREQSACDDVVAFLSIADPEFAPPSHRTAAQPLRHA